MAEQDQAPRKLTLGQVDELVAEIDVGQRNVVRTAMDLVTARANLLHHMGSTRPTKEEEAWKLASYEAAIEDKDEDGELGTEGFEQELDAVWGDEPVGERKDPFQGATYEQAAQLLNERLEQKFQALQSAVVDYGRALARLTGVPRG